MPVLQDPEIPLPTREDIREFLHRALVEESVSHEEFERFARTCISSPMRDVFVEENRPHREAYDRAKQEREVAWLASDAATAALREIRSHTDDPELISELMASAANYGSYPWPDGSRTEPWWAGRVAWNMHVAWESGRIEDVLHGDRDPRVSSPADTP